MKEKCSWNEKKWGFRVIQSRFHLSAQIRRQKCNPPPTSGEIFWSFERTKTMNIDFSFLFICHEIQIFSEGVNIGRKSHSSLPPHQFKPFVNAYILEWISTKCFPFLIMNPERIDFLKGNEALRNSAWFAISPCAVH
jgi:hypothetical protein